jgi:membrane-associated phospholipid phosphatase
VGSIAAFYLTYLCYRNVKSYVPLLRPELHDYDLLEFERSIFGDHPAQILHDVLGTGIAAHVLSSVYLIFLLFVPVSLGIALVWSTRTSIGLWWVAALSLNWVFGALSYFLVPALGPSYAAPQLFSDLPNTGVSALHQALLDDRNTFLASPVESGGLQSIAAFASLHVAIVFTGALMAHVIRAPKPVRVFMWCFLVLTILATIYFGWHYVVDDVAGFAIGGLSVYLAALLTGWRIERDPPRRRRGLQVPDPV